MGRDHRQERVQAREARFNPRARVGRDMISSRPSRTTSRFNPRARVGRDVSVLTVKVWLVAFQSTRPRGARLTTAIIVSIIIRVSIHAPAWGATSPSLGLSLSLGSFNPRARVGRDSLSARPRHTHGCFNPRARVGRDPTWLAGLCHRASFNPRARVGRDITVNHFGRCASKFQSTRPRGIITLY